MVAYLRGPDIVAGYITGIAGTSGPMIMFLLVVLFVIVGDFIDAVPAIIIFMPIINKLTEIGNIKPLHMGVVIITTLVFGLITPPYGLSLLVASKYVGVGFGRAVVRSLPLYVGVLPDHRLRRAVPRRGAVAAESAAAGIGRLLQEPGRRGVYLPAVRLRPLTPHLGAEVSGVDLAGDVSDGVFRELYGAFLKYRVLLFPPRDLPPAARWRSRAASAKCRCT